MTAAPAEIAIIELVTAEIEKAVGSRLTRDECRDLAARSFKIIDDYNRTIAIAVMDKAKDVMVAAAAAAAGANNKPIEGK